MVGVVVLCDIFVKRFQKGIVFETAGFDSEEELADAAWNICFFWNFIAFEFTIGRGSGKGAARAFEELETKGSKWHYFKWVSVVGSYILMAFYTMVAGWMLYYAWREASGALSGLDTDGVSGAFSDMLSQPGTMTIWMIIAVLLSFGVCRKP